MILHRFYGGLLFKFRGAASLILVGTLDPSGTKAPVAGRAKQVGNMLYQLRKHKTPVERELERIRAAVAYHEEQIRRLRALAALVTRSGLPE